MFVEIKEIKGGLQSGRLYAFIDHRPMTIGIQNGLIHYSYTDGQLVEYPRPTDISSLKGIILVGTYVAQQKAFKVNTADNGEGYIPLPKSSNYGFNTFKVLDKIISRSITNPNKIAIL